MAGRTRKLTPRQLALRRARRLLGHLQSLSSGHSGCWKGWTHVIGGCGQVISTGRIWTLYDPGEGPFLDSEGREWELTAAQWGLRSPINVTPEGSRCIACWRGIDYLDEVWERQEDGASMHEHCVQVVPVEPGAIELATSPLKPEFLTYGHLPEEPEAGVVLRCSRCGATESARRGDWLPGCYRDRRDQPVCCDAVMELVQLADVDETSEQGLEAEHRLTEAVQAGQLEEA